MRTQEEMRKWVKLYCILKNIQSFDTRGFLPGLGNTEQRMIARSV